MGEEKKGRGGFVDGWTKEKRDGLKEEVVFYCNKSH